jgi:uncharacterized coiled-coil protein SlyX
MSTIYSTSPAEQIKELNRTIAELRQRVAALEAELGRAKLSYQKLLELNQRNCDDAARIHATSEAVMSLIKYFMLNDRRKASDNAAGQEGQGEAHAND